MTTNNAVSFNQLKKSVFNMKNYMDYNTNNPYTVKTLLDETIAIDANCNITNNGNAISVYKDESEDGYSCYFCWNKTNTPIDVNEEFISMKIYINDKLIYNQVPKHITSGIALSTNSTIDKYLDKDTNVIKFVTLSMYHNKKVYYDENGKNHSDAEENTQSYKAIVSIKKGQQNPGTARIVGEFLTENKNYPGINCFKSGKYGSLTYASNIDDTGIGSINLSNDPSPDYTFIMPCSTANNSFKNTCSSGIILGSSNKLNGINYYSIVGFNNTIERKANASYNELFVNILGQYNTYKADASTVNYKPVSILGNYINACNSGLYIGMAGTFEKDDIMGIADGTARKEKIIFRVKRDGRVKASAPTENDDLSTKKYVDDKVAGIVNSAPETLDTLQELATALGNDPNFATTVATQIGKKVDKVEGMTLTHNDLTKELKANYDAAYEYSQAKHSYNDLTDKPVIPSIAGLATTEYVDSKSLPILFLDDSNRTGDKLFPLLPEHNLVFLAGDAQFTDENGNINIIYGLCYSDLQSDGSKLLTEYRTGKSASISTNGTLKSFDYIDEYTKTILTLFKNAPSGKVLVKNQNNTFEWIELPTNPDLSSYAPITSPVFKKSISIGNVAPDKTLGENSIIVSSYGEASGIYTLSNGKSAIARADYSHAEGYASMSKGLYSHAEGEQTGAIGQSSHSEGHGGDANGVASHVEGYYTTSNGKYSHAEGYRTIATGDNQHVQGKYNIEDKANKYAHIVGNGYRDELNYKDYRSNGYTLDWSGNGWFAGKVTQEGTPTDDKDLVNKKYVDDANVEATDEEVDAMLLEVLGGDYSVQS